MNFKKLEGKEIIISDYFLTLTEKGWKFDREERSFFHILSKTFWEEGYKVSILFEEDSPIPPDEEEENVIETVEFFKFDTKRFIERTIESEFEIRKLQYPDENETIEEFEVYLRMDYAEYLAYIDFNTHADFMAEDYKLLQKVDFSEVPQTILKEVWADLRSCKG